MGAQQRPVHLYAEAYKTETDQGANSDRLENFGDRCVVLVLVTPSLNNKLNEFRAKPRTCLCLHSFQSLLIPASLAVA